MNLYRKGTLALGICLVAATLWMGGCGHNSSDDEISSAPGGDPGKAAEWAAGTSTNPHAQAQTQPPAETNMASAPAAEGGPVTASGLSFIPNEAWQKVPSMSNMRKAQYSIPGDAGTAELVLFHFAGMGGAVQANLQRWAGQMGSTMDQAEVKNEEVGSFKLTTIAVAGTYDSGMATGPFQQQSQPQTGYKMIATVIEGDGGPWFFKLTGPEATVNGCSEAYYAMLQTVKPGA